MKEKKKYIAPAVKLQGNLRAMTQLCPIEKKTKR